VVATLDVSDPEITISGDTLTINPAVDLADDASYYITIDSGAIADSSGNNFGGIADPEGWSFTVPDATPPVVTGIVVSGTPPSSAVAMQFTVYFSEVPANITKEDFNLSFTGTASASIASNSPVNANTVTVTIDEIAGVGTLRLDVKANSGIT